MKRYIFLDPNTKLARLGGRPQRVIIVLLALQIGLFLIYAFADGPVWVSNHLAASAARCFRNLELWQPFTAMIVHITSRTLLYDALNLWLFGTALVRYWGPRRFFMFWLVTGAAGNIVAVFLGVLQPDVYISGTAGATIAQMIAVAAVFPNHLTFFFGVIPIKAKIISLVLAGILVLSNILSHLFLDLSAQLTGGAIALIFLFPPKKWIGKSRKKDIPFKFEVIDGGKSKKKDEKRWLN